MFIWCNITGLILGLGPANERRRYKRRLSLAGPKPRFSPVSYLGGIQSQSSIKPSAFIQSVGSSFIVLFLQIHLIKDDPLTAGAGARQDVGQLRGRWRWRDRLVDGNPVGGSGSGRFATYRGPEGKKIYREISNISCTKSQNLNVFRLFLQLSLCNLLKPGVKSKMKM